MMLLFSEHTNHSNENERNRQDLSHIKGEGGLKGFLDLLGVLDEEAEGEDIGQTEAEVPASTYFLSVGIRLC